MLCKALMNGPSINKQGPLFVALGAANSVPHKAEIDDTTNEQIRLAYILLYRAGHQPKRLVVY